MKIFETPLCNFWVEDELNNKIDFELFKEPKKAIDVYIDNDESKIIQFSDFQSYHLVLQKEKLEISKKYFLKTSKCLEFDDSDERVVTYSVTSNNKCLVMSIPEPNDEVEKFENYEGYYIEPIKFKKVRTTIKGEHCIDDYEYNSFAINWLDKETYTIDFTIAWIDDIPDHIDDYENAIGGETWCTMWIGFEGKEKID